MLIKMNIYLTLFCDLKETEKINYSIIIVLVYKIIFVFLIMIYYDILWYDMI